MTIKKTIAGVLLSVTAMLTISGCSTQNESQKANQTEASSSAKQATEIINYNYAQEEITLSFDKVPEKVVTVYQSPLEIMLALGLEDKVVAASQLDTDVKPEYEEAFKKIKYYEQAPSKEEVMGLKPDLIYSWYSFFGPEKLGDVSQWIERGTNTYMMRNSGAVKPDSVQNEYDDILAMGKIFQVEEKAEAIVAEMKAEIDKAKEHVKDKEPVKAIIVEVNKDGMYRVYGEDSIGGDMATQVGAELVADKNGDIGKEELLKLNPDVIFSVYYGESIEREQAEKMISEDQGLGSLSAIKNNRIVPIVLSEVYATGIRTLDGIKTISNGLYPDLANE